MNAEIIAVGSELLLGQIVNSNGKFLSERLSQIGIDVYYHSVVGDNELRLLDVLNSATKRSDILVITGGLGPTKDDLTKETVAKQLGKKLTYDIATEERIHQFFQKRGREMTENNRKQALVIEGSHIFQNNHGLACGMAIESGGKLYILLPGPPKELNPMFDQYVIPYLKKHVKNSLAIESRVLRFFNIGESQLVDQIDDILESQTNPTIAPLASDGEVTLRLTVKGESQEENDTLLDQLQAKVLQRVGSYFYGFGEETLTDKLVKVLKEQQKCVSCAESLTGGLFASEITNSPGASGIFNGGIVCYSNEVKQKELHIPKKIIEEFGAVSHSTAKELASQIRVKMNSDYGISFTGVAGPDLLEGKPPGTVYIGISSRDKTDSFELKLAGSRENIRGRSVKYGAYFLLQWIRKEMEKVEE